jgi:DNA-binding CsgD family transcriptional regulator
MYFEETGATVEELRAVLARIETAVLTVDRTLRLYFANPAAQGLIRRGDGLRLDGDRLYARKASDTRVLAAAVGDGPRGPHTSAHAMAASAPVPADKANAIVTVWRGDEAVAYRVAVFPLLHPRYAGKGATAEAVLFVDTPPEASPAAEAELFQHAFQLTRAEARLAVHLMSGRSLTEAADLFGVSHNTVRSQLRVIFEKTQTRRQADLVRLLHSHRSVRLSLS